MSTNLALNGRDLTDDERVLLMRVAQHIKHIGVPAVAGGSFFSGYSSCAADISSWLELEAKR